MPTDIVNFKFRNEFESIFRSKLILQILHSLGEGERTLTELRDVTGSSSQAIIPIIRKLEFNNLILRRKNGYNLTPIGVIMNKKITSLFFFFTTVSTNKKFFLEHYLEAIPYPFLEKIEVLHDSVTLTDTQSEIFAVYQNFLHIVQEAKWIYGISSIISIGHAKALTKRIKEKINVELIINEEVLVQLRSKPYHELICELVNYENFKVFQYPDELKLGLVISDSFLSLGLYKEDMITYDTTSDLICKNPSAIAWGEGLFQYFKEKSKLINLVELNK